MRFVLVWSVLAVGCFEAHPAAERCTDDGAEPPHRGEPTWYRDVQPIVAAKCGGCHIAQGPGPFALESYDDVASRKELVRHAVSSRRMPPWPPARCCNRYRDDRSLTEAELATVLTWIDRGAPPGTPAPTIPPVRRGLDRVDLTLSMSEPYTPSPPPGATDDTRCFLIDWPETEPAYVTGIDIRMGHAPAVHHALVLVASADDARRLEALDAQAEGPGWPCPGGVVTSFKGWLGGSFFEATRYPDGTGHEVLPGDKLVLTMHYSRPARGDFQPDRTSVQVRLQREPTRRIVALSVFNPAWLLGGMRIPAGEREVTYTYADEPSVFAGGRSLTLIGANLHMHERGTRGQVVLIRAGGERECLLQIDAWDHDWQGDYTFAEPKELRPGDRLLVSCTFDNSPENQRFVGGERQPVRDLSWGEDQEMCVAFVNATPN